MTDVRRLVHSVLVPGFTGTSAPDWVRRAAEAGLGGVCWFGQNVTDPVQARRLADSLHDARADLLVLSDEEGGDVTRLEASAGSSWPGHAALGHLDDQAATRSVAAGLGGALRSAGVDVALAPVVDVNANPDNPVIGVRSFGADPALVSRHGAAFVEGLQSAGVAACAKHFPGHGSTVTDSHVALPRVDDPADVVRRRDLAPFAAAIAAGARCVMTAHVVFAAFDSAPATLSPILLGLLREDLAFDGVIISDALDMHAISRGVGRVEGAVRALNAGVDLLCIGNPVYPDPYDEEDVFDEVARGLLRAADDGRLDLDRLEQAAARVAGLAAWVRDSAPAPSTASEGGAAPTAAARVVARSLAVRGDVVIAGSPVVVVLAGAGNRAAGRVRDWVVEAVLGRFAGADVVSAGTPAEAAAALGKAGDRPLVVVVGQHPDDRTDAARDAVLSARPDAVVVYTGVPRGDSDAGERTVHTHGGGRVAGVALADRLAGAAGS